MSSDNKAECSPIKYLNDLLSWEESQCSWKEYAMVKSSRADYAYDGSLENRTRYSKSCLPRTLLCHDMKGGYLEDRFVHGTSDVSDPYIFTHWSLVDIFVYFSHQFVTIPPLGWINAAHSHGVQILGTIITEWKDGEKLWQELFEHEDKIDKMINKLVEICKHCKFDGYLVNIENVVPAEHLDKMKNFVRKLTLQMHEQVNNSLIIWYDSIISPTGELKWQNELNASNKDFFEVSDGIFLNYNWTDETLQTSLKNAGVRQLDLYVGVDVFGRGCFGGGGFNCNLAMEKIRHLGLSAAIFGHGWTHETKSDSETFHERESLFWNKLRPYLFTHVLRVDKNFYTCFNSGFGIRKFLNGHKEKDSVSFNLSTQSIQTCSEHKFHYEDGFNGTCCAQLKMVQEKKYQVLFLNQVQVDKQFKLRVSTKCMASYDYKIFVFYESQHPRQIRHKFILKKDDKMSDEKEDFSSTTVYETPSSSGHRKKALLWFQSSWDVRTFAVESQYPGYLTEIGIEFTSEPDAVLLLGDLKIYRDSSQAD